MTPVSLLLLPGLEGTGRLFDPFLRVLPERFAPLVMSYPVDVTMSYDETVDFVFHHIPRDTRYVVLGESYSGPVALGLAARYPSIVQAIVLCSTFISSPYPLLLPWLSRLIPPSFVLHHPPRALTRYFMCGEDAPDTFVDFLADTMRTVHSAVLTQRVENIIGLDGRSVLKQCPVPLLYLHGQSDHLVSREKAQEIFHVRPDTFVAPIPGPHMLLQRRAEESLSAIERFLTDLSLL